MTLPAVVGFKLTYQPDQTATNLVLTIVQILRKRGVVCEFVEFLGDYLGRHPFAIELPSVLWP